LAAFGLAPSPPAPAEIPPPVAISFSMAASVQEACVPASVD